MKSLVSGDHTAPWLSRLKKTWPNKPLKYVALLNRTSLSENEEPTIIIRYIDISSVNSDGTIGHIEPMPFASAPSRARRVVKSGDTIVSTVRTYLKAVAPIPEDDNNLIVSTGFAVISPNQSILDAKFLSFWLRGSDFVDEVCARSVGVSYPATNSSEVGAIPTPLPPLHTQKAIADYLDRKTAAIDSLIEKKERLIALLEEKRAALINQAVTKGLDPNVPMKDSGIEWLGEIPAHWEAYPLKALFELKHGYAFDGANFSNSGDFVLMTPGNFNEGGGFRRKVPEKYYVGTDIPTNFILEAGQLLVAMTEQAPGLLGSALFVPTEGIYLHNQRLGLVNQVRCEKVSEQYLFHLFNSSRYRAEVSISSTGSKVKHTSPQKILSIKIWLPPLSEQESIARFLNERLTALDNLEAKVEQKVDLLKERRQALITAAVTGKIDVTGEAT